MNKRSVRFSVLIIFLTIFLGFGVSFVTPKPVRADALGDFIKRLTLGDFIRNLFVGIFGGSAGDPSYPYPTAAPTTRPTNTPVPLPPTSTPRPGGATSTPGPTNTPVPLPPVNTPAPTNPVNTPCYYNVKLIDASGGALPSALQTGNTESGGCRTPGVRELVPSYYTQGSSSTNRPEWPCTDATYVGQNCTQQGCTSGRYRCNTPNPECQYENLNACISDDCSRRGGNCTQQGCNSGRYRCTISAPSATPTARPTNTPVPLPPTSTPRPGGATSTPGPTNTPVPLPPVNSPAPTNPVNTPCYYNVKLIDASGGALPSALQTGNTESGGCRTPGVRELVPSYYTQGSSSTNRPEWPCTDATYVGQNCTQGIVTGQFVCMGGPLHEIKGCYNRSSGAYQRVSVTSLGPTNTPMPEPTNTPAPAYGSFDEWAAAFRRYLYGSGQYSVSLSDLEDWRNDVPPVITPTPTELP